MRYCFTWRKWLEWDGRRWAEDATGEVIRRAKETVASIGVEAANAEGDGERKALLKHALMSEDAKRIAAMIRLAESEPGIPVTPDQLDRDPWALNVLNGTLDLRSGELRPHRREDLITKLVPVEYDQGAPCPTWLAFLDRIMAGHASLIDFLRRAIGYSLAGLTVERVLIILHGLGRNGKTTLMETLLAVFGSYGMQTPTETLMAKRDTGIPNDVARLKGARLVAASEGEQGRRLAESLVKRLTGGDTIVARFMRSEWFEFRPEFQVWLSTNHKPEIRGTDPAIWDRIELVPFSVRIPEAEQDKELAGKLRAELPGILAWAVRGCREWQREGLKIPEEVRRATEGYRGEMDVIGDFLEDCCLLADGESATAKALYGAYKAWCEGSGEPALTQKAFGQRLGERGLTNKRAGHANATTWFGIGLRQDRALLHDATRKAGINGLSESFAGGTTKTASHGVAGENGVAPWRCACGSYERRHRPQFEDWVCDGCTVTAPAPTSGGGP